MYSGSGSCSYKEEYNKTMKMAKNDIYADFSMRI